jgi:hypothetical protein
MIRHSIQYEEEQDNLIMIKNELFEPELWADGMIGIVLTKNKNIVGRYVNHQIMSTFLIYDTDNHDNKSSVSC